MDKKSSGIILHPVSFFGKFASGDLGDGAKLIIDWLKRAGQSYLQILPIGPVGYGNSPYQSFSAFAGNPYFISLDKLFQKGLLTKEELSNYPEVDFSKVDYRILEGFNLKLFELAFKRFIKSGRQSKFDEFCFNSSSWLNDYSDFMSLQDTFGDTSWNNWNLGYESRENYIKKSNDINYRKQFHEFLQFEFCEQWRDFKKYAGENNIKLIGDLPIFVSYDSADVWANKELFLLDDKGNPTAVAGVPPDYFSATGQLWGNPIYNWNVMKKNNFNWWKERIRHILKFVDCIRVDHFRGFEAYWEIPFGEETAINGRWVKAPGKDFFNSLKAEYKEELQDIIIAEDLGIITDEVKELRDYFGLPGMRVFEFADFNEVGNENSKLYHDYFPENYIERCIAYLGTHDNDTLRGWYDSLTDEIKKKVLEYLNIVEPDDLNFAAIKKVAGSKAYKVMFLMQDILSLGTECRMNTPGTCGNHNWSWRVTEDLLSDETAERLFTITRESGRV